MIQVGIMFKSFLLTSQMNFLSSTKTLTSVGETKCVCVCTKEGPVNHYFKSTKLIHNFLRSTVESGVDLFELYVSTVEAVLKVV